MGTTRSMAAAVAAFFVFPAAVAAQDSSRPGPPVIITSGQGEVRVPPDRATVSIGVQSRAATAAAATAENSRRQKAVIDAIKARGIPAEQVSTMGFSVQPETQVDRTGQVAPKTLSYVVSNVVTVDLSRIELVGPVIDASIAAGANQIQGLEYRIANADSARRAALAIAVGAARGDAEVVARAAGGSLGQLIELSATDFQAPRYRMAEMAGMQMRGVSVPVEPGLESVRASISVRWQFIPGPR
jgi:uncharacterized protein YggE